MLRRLATIRRRVDRLATQAASAACAGCHQRIQIVFLDGDDPVPAWPEADADRQCGVCGKALQFVLFVNTVRSPSRKYSTDEERRQTGSIGDQKCDVSNGT